MTRDLRAGKRALFLKPRQKIEGMTKKVLRGPKASSEREGGVER